MKYISRFLLAILSLTATIAMAQTKEDIQSLYDSRDFVAASAMIEDIESNYKKDDRAQILFGDVYLALGQVQEAYKYYLNAYELEGDEHYILSRLAKANSRLGAHDKALEQMEEAIDDEDLQEYKIDLIDIYARKGDYDEARKQADRILRDDPENVQALKFLGDVYHMQRVYEVSKNNYEKLLKIDSTFVDARLKLAEAYYWLGQRTGEDDKELGNMYFKKSLDEYNKVTLQDPKNATAFFEEGKILFYSNQFLPAAKALSKYVKLRPDGDLGRWYLAQSFNELGSCDSAAPHLKIVAEKIDTVRDKASLMLARCYSDQRQYQQARTELERLGQTMELDLNDRRRLATATLFTGDTTEAIALYKGLVEEAPEKQCAVMKTVGQLLVSMKQYDEAIWFFNRRLDVAECADPATDGDIYYYMGLSYLFSDKFAEAKDALYKAIEIDSTNTQAMLYLADAYMNVDNSDMALQTYNKVASYSVADLDNIDTRMVDASYGKIAGVYQKARDWNKLESVTQEWTKYSPNNKYGWIYLGVAYQGQQSIPSACKAYKKALEIDPNDKTANDLSKKLGC
jgi:tetratricopeptide (TPR) repeat protein